MSRVRIAVITVVLLASLGFIVYRIAGFASLFFEHSGIAITQDAILAAHSGKTPEARPQVIPKIIHHVFHDWHNESMPKDWDDVRQTCINLNPDWEYKLWTEQSSRDFIEESYPWFLSTYDSYKYPVQRVDTVRLFLLREYGGIYLDLDNGCLQSLEPLLYYPSFTTDGGHGALSNNILGSEPNHTFFQLLTTSLISYNYNYFFPYITISYASGQWFETAVWEAYHKKSGRELGNRLHRVMMDSRPGADPWIFFTHGRGGSWLNWDNEMFMWIGDHLLLLSLAGCVLALLLGWAVMLCVRRLRAAGSNENYSLLKQRD